jgi:hypothetical protein
MVTLCVIVAGIAILLNPSWLAPFVEKQIAAATGREVHIGALELRAGRCLLIAADDVHIGNPDWAKVMTFASNSGLSVVSDSSCSISHFRLECSTMASSTRSPSSGRTSRTAG